MAKLDIVQIPAPILRARAEPLERIDEATHRLMADMLETMYAAPGIGLAAPQVNVPRRIVVIDTSRSETEPKNPIVMVNPEILATGDAMRDYEEGCLSIPDVYAEVSRPATLRVKFTDRSGSDVEMDADGLLATVIQHEIDHLNGMLFIDHISRLKRELLIKKFYKARRENAVTT